MTISMFWRIALAAAIGLPMANANARPDVFPDTVFGDGFEPCSGLECQQTACAGGASTTVSGTVFMPNGTLTLPNVEIYVPNAIPTAPPAPPARARCEVAPSGHPIAATLSGADGTFVLRNVPVGQNIPLVLLAGKWSRQVFIPAVQACTNTALAADAGRLPRSSAEGHIPRIAVSTGAADSLECVLRKAGVDDGEFGIAGSSQRIHLFSGNGADRFDAAHGSGVFPSSPVGLWANATTLSAYDDVLLACEGTQNPGTKPQTSMDAMKAFADAGGRVLAAHWSNIWLQDNAPSWVALASWDNELPTPDSVDAAIDTSNRPGDVLSDWLVANGFSTAPATIPIISPKHTLVSIDEATGRKLAYNDDVDGVASVQLFTAVTPVEANPSARRGRLTFTDMHPGSGDSSTPAQGFPSGGCHSATTDITPQDAALLYAMFDLERCVDGSRD